MAIHSVFIQIIRPVQYQHDLHTLQTLLSRIKSQTDNIENTGKLITPKTEIIFRESVGYVNPNSSLYK